MTSIKSKLVKDGNSTAVRIPKTLLELSGISGAIEISAERGRITIKGAQEPRLGWAKAIDSEPYTIDQELADWDSLAGDTLDD